MPVRKLSIPLLALIVALAALPAAAAQDWTLTTADGGEVSFGEALAKGPVVLSYWALWCGPCLKELPHLNEIAAEFEGRVTVIAINADDTRSVHKVPAYLSSRAYDHLTVALDTSGDVRRKMQVPSTLPFLALYDADGRVVYRHTGYREGDEAELHHEIAELLAGGSTAGDGGGFTLQVTNQFEASETSDPDREDDVSELEIFENWLDVAVGRGGLRAGIMFNVQDPSEEGDRGSEIRHKFVEYDRDNLHLRAGHFYGMFGRGLLFAAYEDRVIRVDTALEGGLFSGRLGRFDLRAFQGSPSELDVDVSGLDAALRLPGDLRFGASFLSWEPEASILPVGVDDPREWAASGRLSSPIPGGDIYVEYGRKDAKDWEGYPEGEAFYGGLNIGGGGFGFSLEAKDYDHFSILDRADGKVALNRGPSLTREHLYTMVNRYPLNQNMNDELGTQAELNWRGGKGWYALLNASRIIAHGDAVIGEKDLFDLLGDPTGDFDAHLKFEEIYLQVERDAGGPVAFRAALQAGKSEGKELRTGMAEIILRAGERNSFTIKNEYQNVDLGGGAGYDLGAFNQRVHVIEFARAPHWTLTGILEDNDIYDEQLLYVQEKQGPFPAVQVGYVTDGGALFTLWAGQRQAGYLCAGGVCKIEPAFEGIEVAGTFRY